MFFFYKSNLKPVKRDFSTKFLLDSNAQRELEEKGFVVLNNMIREEEIEEALKKYDQVKNMEGFKIDERFESSGNFNASIQQSVFEYLEEFMMKTAPRYADLNNCEIGNGGAYFIKPPGNKGRLEPHQDSSVVDESSTYAVFAWSPLVDITPQNGALYLLPKSHLWGNFYRSQHITWAFKGVYKTLWKYMMPVYAQKGDVVLFDSSIIHASEVNNSNEYRIALCGALLPKNHQKVDYLIHGKDIYQYLVDDTYWIDGGRAESLKKYEKKKVANNFPAKVKERDLLSLMN